MIWQQRCMAVLMLNRVMEKGQEKCYQYWPKEVGQDYVLGDVGLKVENVSSVPGEHYTVRKLRLTRLGAKKKKKKSEARQESNGQAAKKAKTAAEGAEAEDAETMQESDNLASPAEEPSLQDAEDSEDSEEGEEEEESRTILHFHYTTWPDFGTPQCPDTFLEFLRAVRDSGSLEEDVGPPVVHCSAGIGRSGTFVLVDSCLVQVAKEGADAVCIRDTLLDLRNFRMGLIQTADQLKFSYLAIAEGARTMGLINDNILAGERNERFLHVKTRFKSRLYLRLSKFIL